MSASGNVFLSAMLSAMLLVGCTKDGAIVYLPNPDEEQASTSPLVTVIYGPNSLGDRSYCDKIYRGVEAAGGGNAGDESTQGTGISDEGATGDNR